MQTVMPDYLDAAMEAFRRTKVNSRMLSRRNCEYAYCGNSRNQHAMVRAATEAFIPNASKRENQAKQTQTSEIEELRKQMAQMQRNWISWVSNILSDNLE